MLVRLAFSVMIQVDADILLIDEVLAVGDAAFQQKCFDEFNRLRDERRTILFVTHDMGSVQRFCDRAMLLERGEIDHARRGRAGRRARTSTLNFDQAARQPEPTAEAAPARGDGAAEIARGLVRGRARASGSRRRHAGQRVRVLRRACGSTSDVEDPLFGADRSSDARAPAGVRRLDVWDERARPAPSRAGERGRPSGSRSRTGFAPGALLRDAEVARAAAARTCSTTATSWPRGRHAARAPAAALVDLPHELRDRARRRAVDPGRGACDERRRRSSPPAGVKPIRGPSALGGRLGGAS